MKNILVASSVMLCSICTAVHSADTITAPNGEKHTIHNQLPAGQLITVADLKKDLNQIKTLLASTHPDPAFTMDINGISAKIDQLSEQLTKPLTHLEAWKLLSQLNPYFQDGHMAVFYPNSSKHLNEHIQNGGNLFPFKVQIDKSNRILVTDTLGTHTQINIGDEIAAINGVKASEITHAILSRMHGDSEDHRRALASDRFSRLYWMLYGDHGHYQVDILKANKHSQHTVAGNKKNAPLADPELTELVGRKILDDNIGYLRIDRFYYSPEHEEAFFSFMEKSWQEFHDAGVQDVIIDVRKNPGGTDHYWHLGIAPYVATEPFSFVSGFKMRLTERNLRLGPVKGEPGSIAEGPFEYLIPVDGKENLRIPGKAYLLMGPLSYSSSVLFLTAFQDAKQAVIAGPTTGVRSCTTGRIQPIILSGSKLEVTVPTAIFTRPSGNEMCHQPIRPDLDIADTPDNPTKMVNELAKKIVANR